MKRVKDKSVALQVQIHCEIKLTSAVLTMKANNITGKKRLLQTWAVYIRWEMTDEELD